uniref:Uncharacterized protein n=1 Tax=Salix viminalis TaxID=40686 RepID=A0A6N2L469_SALVM
MLRGLVSSHSFPNTAKETEKRGRETLLCYLLIKTHRNQGGRWTTIMDQEGIICLFQGRLISRIRSFGQ